MSEELEIHLAPGTYDFFSIMATIREVELVGAVDLSRPGSDTNTFESFTVHHCVFYGNRHCTRTDRFDALRAEGKTLGEINQILCEEGFSEVSGEGVMPCPTKSHEGAKKMVEGLPEAPRVVGQWSFSPYYGGSIANIAHDAVV